MRFCFTSDLHGREPLYQQLERMLRDERPDVLILGGDMFPDGELDDPLGTQVAYIERTFLPRVADWKAAQPSLQVACILGNHDWLCAQDALQVQHDQGRIVLLDHRRPWECNNHRFLGYSSTPPTPYWVKDFERLDRCDDPIPETGGAVWDRAAQRARKAEPRDHFTGRSSLAVELQDLPELDKPWVFVCHAPPFDTKLDRLPHVEHPIGSRAVREVIEQRGPELALHGHVHESPEVTGSHLDQVGKTLCANPGQSHDRLHAVLFDLQRPAQTLRHTVFS